MIIIAWIITVALFLIKITRYENPSWFQVLLPVIIGYGALVILFLISEIGDAVEDHRRYKAALRRHDVGHIEPLDSIKHPRR